MLVKSAFGESKKHQYEFLMGSILNDFSPKYSPYQRVEAINL